MKNYPILYLDDKWVPPLSITVLMEEEAQADKETEFVNSLSLSASMTDKDESTRISRQGPKTRSRKRSLD